jgi:secondary thiamine-phosphate synthase enzyme
METHARTTRLDVDLRHHRSTEKIRRGAPTLVSEGDGGPRTAPRRRSEGGMPAAIVGGSSRHALLHVATSRATQFVDITDRLGAIVATCGVRARLINIQTLHTTTGIVVNEHEPLLLTDFEATLEKAAPAAVSYRHDDADLRTVNLTPDERVNGHAHCRALLLPMSACLNVVDGRLLLGRWQRVFLVELDGPRERVLSLMVIGDTAEAAPAETDPHEADGDGQ